MDFSTGMWSLFQTLKASDAIVGAVFGTGLAVDDSVLVVGSSGYNNSTGAAYVFELIENEWVELQKLAASNGQYSEDFGTDVSIFDDIIVVTAQDKRDKNRNQIGATYVFRRIVEGEDTLWIEEAELTASDGGHLDNYCGLLAR